MGYLRRMSGPQGDRAIVIKQEGFLGGMNLDLPSSEIDATEVADAENVVLYRTHVEARSGWTQYGTSLPTTPNLSTFFHKRQGKWIVITDSYDVYVYNEAYTSGANAGNIGANAGIICEHGNNVIIIGASSIYLVELDNSNYLRILNQANPTIPLQITQTASTGAFKYRYVYTWCRYVGSTLVAESGTIADYTEITTSTAISDSSTIGINGNHGTSALSYWTHVRIYRTLDIGTAGLAAGNNPSRFYFCLKLTLAQLDSFTNLATIGGMTIGTTFVINGLGDTDTNLESTSTLCNTLDYIPLPSFVTGIGDIGAGYLVVSGTNTGTYYYSADGITERLGYYHPSFQLGNVKKGHIIGIYASTDSFLIICEQQTYRLSSRTYSDAGSPELGLTIPQLGLASLSDEKKGTLFPNSIEKIGDGSLIGLLSDHSVRIWDGSAWGKDYGKFKIETELAKIKYAQGLFDPRGIYFLFYRYNDSGLPATNCLRLGLTEEVGIGWTKYTGSSFIFPVVYHTDPYLGKNCVNFTHSDGFNRSIVFGAFSTGTGAAWIETYDATSLTRATTDYSNSTATAVACLIQPKDAIGSEERFFINHAQTNLYLRPWDRLGSFLSAFAVTLNAYTDENSSASSTISATTNYDKDLFFDDPVIGHKIRIKITTNKGGFKLTGLSSIFNVQDRPILRNLTTSDRTYIEALTSDLLFRMSVEDPTLNLTVGNVDGTRIGAYTSTIGQAKIGSSNVSTLEGTSTTSTTFATTTYKNAKYISFNGVPS